jgi:8-oxo-dGTP pyrophosphatase MutT (NUDIX family)
LSHRDYPNLFAETTWGAVHLQFEALDVPPEELLISNANIVPFIGESCVVIRLGSGEWEVPGGTKEPGETHIDTAKRELMEEAGAQLLTFRTIGAWRCRSSDPEPWKPHLPHPDFYRLVGYADVAPGGVPLNPEGGEMVTHVEVLSVDEAAERFLSCGRADLAELYSLAAAIRREDERGQRR